MVAQTPPGLVRFTVQRVSGEWILAVPDADVAVLEVSHQRLREENAQLRQDMHLRRETSDRLLAASIKRQQEAEQLLRRAANELSNCSVSDEHGTTREAIDAYFTKEPA